MIRRPDGDYVREAPPLRRLMPHLMPTRSGSVVFFDQQLDVSRTLRFLEGRDYKLFTVVLAAANRAISERPKMNRFVVGRRLYQREHVTLSFAVKKAFADEAKLTTVKVRFDPEDDLSAVARRAREAIGVGKGSAETTSEKEMNVVTMLPRFVARAAIAAQRGLDYFNLLPAQMIEADPLYASMFLANLGSVGLDAAYHHLYEYGTCSIFAVVGRIHRAPVVTEDDEIEVRDVVDVRFSFDERIADGFYAARTLERFGKYIEDPASLIASSRPAAEARPHRG